MGHLEKKNLFHELAIGFYFLFKYFTSDCLLSTKMLVFRLMESLEVEGMGPEDHTLV